MVVIFYLSDQNSTASSMTSLKILDNWFGEIVLKILSYFLTYNQSIEFVRETAHAIEFLILGFLILRTIFYSGNTIGKRIILISLLFSVLYAVSDEIHQIFVEGRVFQLLDIGLDSLGATVGVLTSYFLIRKEEKV